MLNTLSIVTIVTYWQLKADRTKYRSIAKYDNAKIKETNVGLYMGYTYKF